MDDQNMAPQARTRSRRAPYANGERRRAALVDAAFEVFARKGYQRLSIRQIAEEIGTSHTALLHHFGSKDALFEAVLKRREERLGPQRAELIQEGGLLEAVPEVMRRNAEIPGVVQLDATLQAEAIEASHAAHGFVQQREQAFYESVREELELERQRGRLRDGLDLDVIARLVTSQIEGVQLAWLGDRSVDMPGVLTALMDLIRRPEATN